MYVVVVHVTSCSLRHHMRGKDNVMPFSCIASSQKLKLCHGFSVAQLRGFDAKLPDILVQQI